MNINKSQDQNAQCCIEHCTSAFSEGEQTVVNSYKCNGRKISSAEVWNLQKLRKEVAIRTHSL